MGLFADRAASDGLSALVKFIHLNKAFYLIILFNLNVPTLLSLLGDQKSKNGCGSPNHI
jgi:hypothetical protein